MLIGTVSDIDQRAALERLIRDRREDYASLSRMLGRNAAYIQQFVKRGVPRKLDENDRRLLARYFGIAEAELGGPAMSATTRNARRKLVPIRRRIDVGASAGPGAIVDDENAGLLMEVDERWLREIVRGATTGLSIIRVAGDSMAPTLSDGDDIMVDESDGAERLRDGIYVMRRDDVLMVKRLALSPASGRATIRSDNEAYPDWPDCDLANINIIGRVVWTGRKLG